jgi:adenosylcobinamide-GDP ribazoletransferase
VAEGLRLALTTFTVLPSRVARVDRDSARWAMLWSPVVGAAIAAIAAGVLWLVGPPRFATPLLGSALAVSVLALLTRGLHLDGLADTVDGLASHKPADQALAVMSDGPVGALGAAALVLFLLTDVIALGASAIDHRGPQTIVMAVVTGRLAMVWACTPGVPAARPDGMGSLVAGTVPRVAALAWTLVVMLAGWLFGRFGPGTGSVHGGLRNVVAIGCALGVTWAVRRHAVRRLGGVTGDVLGALCEIAVAVSLVGGAAGS